MMANFIEQFVFVWVLYFAAWCVFTFFEYKYPANKKQKTLNKHFYTDLTSGLVNSSIVSFVLLGISSLLLNDVFVKYLPHQIFTDTIVQWPSLLQLLCALFILDGIQYLRHRCTHAFFWSFHTTHHSAVELRSTVHLRIHPVDFTISYLFKTALLFIFGFDSYIIIAALMFAPLHNMWLHVNMDVSYVWPLNYIFASPNYHKWHHAKQRQAIDKNFADFFPILDRIGGTYYYPKDKKPKTYGVYGVSAKDPLHNTYLGNLLYPWKNLFKKHKEQVDS